MLDLTKYDDKLYDDKTYNCLHFTIDLYRDITHYDLSVFLSDLATAKNKRVINPGALKQFKRIDKPSQTCIAIMRGVELHVGVYHKNNIIHFNDAGVNCQPPHIAELKHGRITYYDAP